MITVGVDIGGTYTRVGAVRVERSRGIELATRRRATASLDRGSALIDWLVDAVREVTEGTLAEHSSASEAVQGRYPQVAGIGLALPGILDRERRKVVRSVNVPSLQGLPIHDELAERTGHPVFLSTDSEAATWAEYVTFAPPARSFVHLRIGTGIGCAQVAGGELQRLDMNRSGHLDVLRIDDGPDSVLCPCGARGCLETVASGRVLHQRARRSGYGGGLADLQLGWGRNEQAARTIVDEAARAVARACENLIDQFNASVISLGGGVTDALPCLVEETKHRIEENCKHHTCRSSATILRATHGDRAGVTGAALLASKAL